jgi:RNA polymerase sigma factor (sigma-70 family)
MRDSEVVASILAGDPAGLALAYDRYAGELYGYCRSLLREPEDAADVVQDTFVIAAVSLGGLRDPERLRPWLYAVARNLCLRKLRADKAAAVFTAPESIPEISDVADVGDASERAELRALLRAAAGGLNAGEREIIELRLWQGLDNADAAAVLDITRGHAHALLSRARGQLQACVGVLLVARTGRQDCAVLDGILTGWDGQLTVLLRKRLSRHIERCDICANRKRRELQPALLGLAGAVAAEQARHAAGVPAGLKDQVLKTAAGHGAGHSSGAAVVTAFGRADFPGPVGAHRAFLPRGTRARVAAAGGAAAAAAVAVIAVFGGTHHAGIAGGPPGGRPGSGPGASVVPSAAPSGHPAKGGRGGRGGTGGPGPAPVVTLGPVAASRPGVLQARALAAAAATSAPGSPSPSAPGSAPPASTRQSPPPSASPSPSATPPPPAPGTLLVSPTTIVLTVSGGAALTLTAENGPVSWSISESASLAGKLIVSPASGTLAAGQSTQVTISVSGLASVDTTLTVNPGGHRVTVLLGVGLLAKPG